MDKINFQNGASGKTPINANNLNLMQTNTENAINSVATEVNNVATEMDNREKKGHVLYKNTVGTLGDVGLSDNALNYEFIEVFGYRGDREIYLKVKTDKTIFNFTHARILDEGIYIYIKELLINGAALNVQYSKYAHVSTDGTITVKDIGEIYITEVVGYNKKV